MNNSKESRAEVARAFLDYERNVRIQNYRVACIVAIIFMPAGLPLDYFVYPEEVGYFFKLRLASAAFSLFIWWWVRTPLGLKWHRVLGVVVAANPSFFIAWMICFTEGAHSPYYAGLNLVLLGAALVLRWTLVDSILVFVAAISLYLSACFLRGPVLGDGRFFANLWFMGVTGVFVALGSYFYNRIRFREFELRFELDKSKRVIEESNQKLLELDQVKSRFFANISHELRTPLTLLLAPLETLRQRFPQAFDAETRELLMTMQANGMRLLKLINDLLDLVRLEWGRMEVRSEALAMTEFIKGLASAVRPMAEDKRLRFETFVDPALGTVWADRDKLEKVLLNLQFNALKFTPAGGRVELRAEKQGEEMLLTVRDTGMGISPKHLPLVFDRFWQADGSSNRRYQGVGIGLALVKELVEVLGGTVTVESEEGKGTAFTARLPYFPAAGMVGNAAPASGAGSVVTEPPAKSAGGVSSEEWLANLYRRAELFPAMTPGREPGRPGATDRDASRPRVLIAEDEPDMRRFLQSQLSLHYQVLEAVDGRQAVEKATQFLPDLILLDMMMPEKDGLEVCRELRQETSTQRIPIVLLTARADEETKLSALSAGASDFLAKPFSTTELHVRIKNLVDSYHYQQRLSRQNQVLESTIDQLKETESQLVQSEKLASLGRMSAGIIHEINNPLNFATTGLFTLRHKAKHLAETERAEYAEILGDVEEGIKRVKNIVSDLREFTHPDTVQFEEVDARRAVAASLRFLSNEWKDQVEIVQLLPEGQTIWANQTKLTQVLVNLLQNSLDALQAKPGGGEKPTIWIEGKTDVAWSTLIIRDNGAGIDPGIVDKIFDPFFTTKDVGRGMGLGLSICYRIVQDSDGKITVRSEAGKFCEFKLEFPVREHVAGPESARE